MTDVVTTTAGFLPNVRPGAFITFTDTNVREQLDSSQDIFVSEGILESAVRDGDTVQVTVTASEPGRGTLIGSVTVELVEHQTVTVEP